MKRTGIIIASTVILILLLLVWLYLLLFNTPSESGERFANFALFGGGSTEVLPAEEDLAPPPEPTVNVDASPLRQLTTRPVVGFVSVAQSSTTPEFVYYAEAGTGHVYRIDLESGGESRVSNTTIPGASEAAFNPDASQVALRSGYTSQSEVILGTVEASNTLSTQVLPTTIRDFTFSNRGELLYTETTNTGLTGKALQTETLVSRTLFTVPFFSARMLWSKDPSYTHHLYLKPTSGLMGYFYTVTNGGIAREPVMSNGLTAIANSEYIAYNQRFERQYDSLFFKRDTEETLPSPIITIPEKCVFASATSSTLYCGYQITDFTHTFPDDWYKGTRSFTDSIWRVDLETGSANQLVNPLQSAGRTIDITDMYLAPDGESLYFINKNDRTLWTYRLR